MEKLTGVIRTLKIGRKKYFLRYKQFEKSLIWEIRTDKKLIYTMTNSKSINRYFKESFILTIV